jgi:hypothetical protein
MAAGFTTLFANKVLDHFLLGTAYAQPSQLYLGLATADPGASATLGSVLEPSGGSYARVNIMGTSTLLSAASGGVKTNSGAIVFPTATADWGTISHYFITDGTNVLWTAQFATARPVYNGDTFQIGTGKLALTLARTASPVGGFTTAFHNKMLDHFFKGTSYTQPGSLKMGLCTGDPGASATTLPATNELATANGYAEQTITFAAASSAAKANSGTVTFGADTTSNWGTVSHWIITDATNVIAMGQLDTSRAVVVGDTLAFAAGTVVHSLSRN